MKSPRLHRAGVGAPVRNRLSASILGGLLVGLLATAAAVSTAAAAQPTYTGVVPARLLDTRAGSATVDGQFVGAGPVGSGAVVNLTVLGRGGVPASGVGAVAINVTVAAPSTTSFLTVFPSGATRPTASNLNFTAGQTIANMVIVPIGAGGQISLYNDAGQTQVLVDVLGWYATGAGYNGFSPNRLLDTRTAGGFVGPTSVTNLTVLGTGGVPDSGVGSVVLNVTATAPTTDSYITLYPTGSTRPTASNLNFSAGQTIANMVVVPVGRNGQVSIYNSAGLTQVLVDVLGWFTDSSGYTGLSPTRVLDTRSGAPTVDGQFAGVGQAGPASVLNLSVLGRGGVPPNGVGAVAINITAAQPCAASYVSVYPGGAARPVASNLNFNANQTIANMVIVPVGTDGKISIYNSAGQTQLLVDVLGWFSGSPIAGATPVSVASSGGCGPTVSAVSTECTALTNQARAAAGLAPVTVSVTLNAAAQGHSDYQAAIQTMTHDGPGGNSAGARMTAAGYSWRTWGENVAYGFNDCAAVINAWMNSAGHRANMLNPAFTNIGIAVAIGSNGYKYWTMDLAAPR